MGAAELLELLVDAGLAGIFASKPSGCGEPSCVDAEMAGVVLEPPTLPGLVANREAEPSEAAEPGLGCEELMKPELLATKAGPATSVVLRWLEPNVKDGTRAEASPLELLASGSNVGLKDAEAAGVAEPDAPVSASAGLACSFFGGF